MPDSKLYKQISEKESDKEEIAAQVINKPELLSEIFAGLNSDKARIKYGCDKVLRIISEKKPELLYRKMDFFVANLDSDNNFFKWGAIHVLAKSKPALTEKITWELLKVEKAQYKRGKCRNIALGIAIKSFEQFFNHVEDKAAVIKLMKK